MKTDNELKQLLSRMLPDSLRWFDSTTHRDGFLIWSASRLEVRATELLYVCWLIEQTLSETNLETYEELLCVNNTEQSCIETWCWIHASWQQRTTALAKVKGLM